MLHYAKTARCSPPIPITLPPQHQGQQPSSDPVSAVSSYTIGPIGPSLLVTVYAPCAEGEPCPLLVPKHFPLWILNHPEFRDGYERNFLGEEVPDPDYGQWKSVPHMVNLIYSKLLGEDFEDFESGEVEPNFGAW